jgi:hypothetical protein
MIKEFIDTLDLLETLILCWVVLYGVAHGVKYHLIVVVATFSRGGYSSDTMTDLLNWTWYISIMYLFYYFV